MLVYYLKDHVTGQKIARTGTTAGRHACTVLTKCICFARAQARDFFPGCVTTEEVALMNEVLGCQHPDRDSGQCEGGS